MTLGFELHRRDAACFEIGLEAALESLEISTNVMKTFHRASALVFCHPPCVLHGRSIETVLS